MSISLDLVQSNLFTLMMLRYSETSAVMKRDTKAEILKKTSESFKEFIDVTFCETEELLRF